MGDEGDDEEGDEEDLRKSLATLLFLHCCTKKENRERSPCVSCDASLSVLLHSKVGSKRDALNVLR